MTQFVRFAGCNMKCPGWPCDTPHAIEPKLYINDSTTHTAAELIEKINEANGPPFLCLTGGEPFIQPHALLQEFCELAVSSGYSIECFTNGSVVFPTWALQRMSFMMDWKLEGSGELNSFMEERVKNVAKLRRVDGVKFVICSSKDLNDAYRTWEYLTDTIKALQPQFWVGAAWDRYDPAVLVEFIEQRGLPWRLNLQTHKYIWPADERGV